MGGGVGRVTGQRVREFWPDKLLIGGGRPGAWLRGGCLCCFGKKGEIEESHGLLSFSFIFLAVFDRPVLRFG
jgi:hypothetical protein